MKKKGSQVPEILTVKQLASYLKMDENIIYRLAKSEKIPATKNGAEWRFKKNLIYKWLEEKSINNIKKESK